jgi:hypothetical protein
LTNGEKMFLVAFGSANSKFRIAVRVDELELISVGVLRKAHATSQLVISTMRFSKRTDETKSRGAYKLPARKNTDIPAEPAYDSMNLPLRFRTSSSPKSLEECVLLEKSILRLSACLSKLQLVHPNLFERQDFELKAPR